MKYVDKLRKVLTRKGTLDSGKMYLEIRQNSQLSRTPWYPWRTLLTMPLWGRASGCHLPFLLILAEKNGK